MLLDYVRADMAHLVFERLRILHLNARNMLIHDEIAIEGTIDSAPVEIREIMRRALEVGSTSLILIHNHPSGNPEPSKADVQITRRIILAGAPLGIAVQDHIIIGTEGHVSMRARRLL